jgi:hypothetical protein
LQLLKGFSLNNAPHATGDALCQDHHAHRFASERMACNYTAAAEHLIIRVRYYHQYF